MNGFISEIQMQPIKVLHCTVENRGMHDNSKDEHVDCNLGYATKQSEDDEFYYNSINFCIKYAVQQEDASVYAIVYESVCNVRVKKREGLTQEGFAEVSTFSAISSLIASGRAQLQAISGIFELPVPFQLPLVDIKTFIESATERDESDLQ